MTLSSTDEQPVTSPEDPADLAHWHDMLREALRELRRKGEIGYGQLAAYAWLPGVYMLVMFPVSMTIKVSAALLTLVLLVLLTRWYRRRVRGLVERKKIIERFMNRDPSLVESTSFRRLDILRMDSQEAVNAGLNHLCRYINTYITSHRYLPIWGVIVMVIGAWALFTAAVYLADLCRPNVGFITSGLLRDALQTFAIGIMLLLFLLAAVRRVEHFLAVCLPLGDVLRVRIVGDPSELARGLPALAGKLDYHARSLRQHTGLILAALVLFTIGGTIFAIAASVPGAFGALVCYGVVMMVLVWEFLDENTEFRTALEHSGLAIKLFNGEFTPGMFSPASRTRAWLLLPQARERELARLAALLAVEYGEYLNYQPARLRRYLSLVAAGSVLAVAAVYLLSSGVTREANDVIAFALIFSALVAYLGLSSVLAVLGRLVEILRYLHDAIRDLD